MGHRLDFIERIRERLWPKLHKAIRAVYPAGYAIGETQPQEYAATIHTSEERVERLLCDMGFRRNPIAALKYQISDGNRHIATGSWAWRKSLLADQQLHITLYQSVNSYGIDVYAHWEPSWIIHPIKHYDGQHVDGPQGAEMMRKWLFDAACVLNERDIPVTFPMQCEEIE